MLSDSYELLRNKDAYRTGQKENLKINNIGKRCLIVMKNSGNAEQI